jgi:hypothetical protein
VPSDDWHTIWAIGEDAPFAIDDVAHWGARIVSPDIDR